MRQPRVLAFVVGFCAAIVIAGCAATERPRVARSDVFPELTIVQGQRSERGVLLMVSDDLFVEKVALKPSAQRDLAALAAYLKDHPSQQLAIEGPTVVAGGDQQHRDLSLRRGATVEAYFLRSGVDPHRVERRTRLRSDESARSLPAPVSARSSL